MKKVLILILILGGIVFFSQYFKNENSTPIATDNSDSASVEGSELLTEEYNDPEFGYFLKLPAGYRIESESKYSTRFLPDTKIVGAGISNFIYVSVVTSDMKDSQGEVYNYNPDQFDKLKSIENIGDSANLAEGVPALAEWYSYTYVAEVDIDGQKAKIFQNNKPWEFPSGTSENRFVFEISGKTYILGYYTGGDGIDENASLDPRLASAIIKSFKTSR